MGWWTHPAWFPRHLARFLPGAWADFRAAFVKRVQSSPRRPVWYFANREQAGEFYSLSLEQQKALKQLEVLRELVVEKIGEIQAVRGRLKREFGVDPDQEYRVDETGLRAVPVSGSVPSPSPFATPDVAESFLRAQRLASLTSQAIRTLQLLRAEKERELQLVRERLARFGVRPGAQYEFDVHTFVLYERSNGLQKTSVTESRQEISQ